jgi:hypothetical protein
MTKPYKLIADRLAAPWGRANFGVAPRHSKVQDGVVVGFKSGKIPAGMTFTWHGNPENPPAWASPICQEGRAAYIKAFTRHLEAPGISRSKKMRYQEVLDHVTALEFPEDAPEPKVTKPKPRTKKPRQEAIDRAIKGEVLAEQKPGVEREGAAPAKDGGGVEKVDAGVGKETSAVSK